MKNLGDHQVVIVLRCLIYLTSLFIFCLKRGVSKKEKERGIRNKVELVKGAILWCDDDDASLSLEKGERLEKRMRAVNP